MHKTQSLQASWQVCGQTVGTADVPLLLDLPGPVSATLTAKRPRCPSDAPATRPFLTVPNRAASARSSA